MIWCDMICYDMTWYDMIWYEIWFMIDDIYDFTLDMRTCRSPTVAKLVVAFLLGIVTSRLQAERKKTTIRLGFAWPRCLEKVITTFLLGSRPIFGGKLLVLGRVIIILDLLNLRWLEKVIKHISSNGGLMVVYQGTIRKKTPKKQIQLKWLWFLERFVLTNKKCTAYFLKKTANNLCATCIMKIWGALLTLNATPGRW